MASVSDLYTNRALLAIQESLIVAPTFVLDTMFPNAFESEAEEVAIDIRSGSRRVAAFCSPYVEGKVVAEAGRAIQVMKPAYIKELVVIEPRPSLRRAAGERFNGSMTNLQRHAMRIAEVGQDQAQALQWRFEAMAMESVRTGKCTVAGEGVAPVQVDFGRDPSLTTAITGSGAWANSATCDPIGDLTTASYALFNVDGAQPTMAIMSPDAYAQFWAAKSTQVAYDTRRFSTENLPVGPSIGRGGVAAKGRVGDLEIYVYHNRYLDPLDNTEKDMMPPGQVLLASPQVEGARLFGAILDEDAELKPMEMFWNSYKKPGVNARFCQMQSAPLMVPTRVNASMLLQVG